MKKRINLLKMMVLLGVVVFLYSFGNKRNKKRSISEVKIEFSDMNSPFITHETVNKLLIQNVDTLKDIAIETLDLISMEQRLNNNPMIRNAEVFLTANGILGTLIEQRDPIGRVRSSSGDYYIDADGNPMPLSEVYSARVPLISDVNEEDVAELTSLLLKIREDDFMRKMVVGIDKNEHGDYELELRSTNLKTVFGSVSDIDRKFQNFKTFYKKTKQDSTIYRYRKVDLKFGNQVIATKK